MFPQQALDDLGCLFSLQPSSRPAACMVSEQLYSLLEPHRVHSISSRRWRVETPGTEHVIHGGRGPSFHYLAGTKGPQCWMGTVHSSA